MMMQKRRTRQALAFGTGALLALGLAGCAGMSDPGGSAQPANENCAKVDDVTVVLQWVAQAQFAGYFAAAEEGFYADHCLNVTIQEGGTNVVPQQVLASGNAQFAVSHVIKSMASREEGAEIVNISQIFQHGAYLEVAWADSHIDRLQDFKGKKVGSWGGGNDLTLRSALEGEGVSFATDFEVVQQPFDMSLLLNREADVVQAKTYNEYAQLLATKNPKTGELYQPEDFSVINLQELGYQTLEDGIYARAEWLRDAGNAEVASRFLAATYEGWASCRDDAQGCVDFVLARGSALGASHQLWMMNEVNKLIWADATTSPIGALDPQAWEQTIDIASAAGVLTARPDEGAFRADIHEKALSLLADSEVDLIGADFEPLKVTLKEGGK